MKIGIISEPPPLTTGFARTCKYIVDAIIESGNTPVCFGLSLSGETFDRSLYPYNIWTTNRNSLSLSLKEFLEFEKPDAIIINADLPSVSGWIIGLRTLKYAGPLYSHYVVDCLPIRSEYLDNTKKLERAIVPTQSVLKYLKMNGITNATYAPHGVDKNIFKIIEGKDQLKRIAGLGHKFVIGVFGQNIERKQQPRILQAASILKRSGYKDKVAFYIHCQPKEKPEVGWDLPEITRYLDVSDIVTFPNDGYRHSMGIPLKSNSIIPESLMDLGYVERINMCDIIINASYSGGFELGILEAQACGVPICVTNDRNNLTEVAGKGAYLLSARNDTFWNVGGYKYSVDPDTITEAILTLMNNEVLYRQVIKDGLINVNKYHWSLLKNAVRQCMGI